MDEKRSLFNFWRYTHQYFSNFIDDEHKSRFDQVFFDGLNGLSSHSVYPVFRELIHCLNDAHTDVFQKNRRVSRHFGLKVKQLDSRYFVIGALEAVEAVIPIGSEITELNSKDLKKLIDEQIANVTYSRREYGVEKTLNFLLSDAFCHEPLITFKTPDGRLGTVQLTSVFEHSNFNRVGSIPSFSPKGNVLTNEMTYLRISSFMSEEEIDSILFELNQLQTISKLILDLRGNCGGNGLFAMKLLSSISKTPLVGTYWMTPTFNAFQTACLNNMDPHQRVAAHPNWHMGKSETVYPVSTVMVEKIVVLMDCETISAAEDFLLYAKQMENCVLIGETTAGSSGMPINLDLGGNYWCQICTKHDYIQQPNDFIRKGISPDYPVGHSPDSLMARIDKPLQYAMARI